jgi:dienelactone hydrolase
MTRRRPPFVVALVSLLALAACSDGDDAGSDTTAALGATRPAETTPTTAAPTTTAAATTTTVDPTEAAMAYTEPGPFPVGVTTLQLAKGPQVEVWYPAVEGTTGEVAYDTRDFVPQAVRDLLTADIPAGYTISGARDAETAEGTFPVILRSHGFSGFRVDSSFLTSHLASWGFIVAAPDHPSRNLNGQLGGTASGDRADSVDDLLQTLELLITEHTGDGVLAGHVDDSTVLALGHSAGGGSALGVAADPRVRGYIAMASAAIGRPPDAGTTTTLPTLPDKPSFWMSGSVDGIADPARTKATFDLAPAPSLWWEIEGMGHNAVTDLCTFGNGTGVIGVAEASGLGPLLEAQPQLKALGQDGCVPPATPWEDTAPIVLHATTAWMRWQAGIDAEPVGLDDSVEDAYTTPVQIESK